ncbi:hypothetical protein THIOSC15_2720021 [uncultured Thiomicrorhabdus sp.]
MPAAKKNNYAQKGESKADSSVHMRVPTELKAKWVHEAQKNGMKLTEWIIKKLNK